MLSQLYIENIAVIEKSEINFNKGLNVLTGETGAGKSIVIDAIHAILGQRTSREMIRTGSPSAFVSASFTNLSAELIAFLTELGYAPEEEGLLFLQRSISLEGKGGCRVNGRPAPASVLKEIGVRLINIHGQNESYTLLSPERHVTYLDSIGKHAALLEEFQKSFRELCGLKKELRTLTLDDSEKMRRIDLLRYQIEELTSAQIRIGEQEGLQHSKNRYLNSGRIAAALQEAHMVISGDEDVPGALQALERASRYLQEAARYDSSLASLASRIQGISYEMDDCAQEVRDAANGAEFDPAELEQIEQRLDEIYRLERKYGHTEKEMLEFLAIAEKELEAITFSEQRKETLESEYQKKRTKAQELARRLSELRCKASKLFTEQVRKELVFLDMPNVRIQVEQKPCSLNELGCDEIQFLISTNPGEPPKPLAKIASGGELSRMMLAIKNVLAGSDQIGTLIFDEVDTGISGSAAQKVGLKLREVSKNRQVICVTHSAQIAALADEHLLIQKNVREERTFTDVRVLDFTGRKREIARIIGGVRITELTMKSAQEMLELAGIHA